MRNRSASHDIKHVTLDKHIRGRSTRSYRACTEPLNVKEKERKKGGGGREGTKEKKRETKNKKQRIKISPGKESHFAAVDRSCSHFSNRFKQLDDSVCHAQKSFCRWLDVPCGRRVESLLIGIA